MIVTLEMITIFLTIEKEYRERDESGLDFWSSRGRVVVGSIKLEDRLD